jgi:galacturan 1,4-alpha-galacturonidase
VQKLEYAHRKMTWTLYNAQVDLYGTLNFVPDIAYWLDPANTYRVVFIQVSYRRLAQKVGSRARRTQNQASWFVVNGSDFVIDAHGQGGIEGNGQVRALLLLQRAQLAAHSSAAQTWWNYFATRTRADGDGRPIALTLSHARRAAVRNFRVNAPPFWCNTVADSAGVVYDGMVCNATNTNPAYAGQK